MVGIVVVSHSAKVAEGVKDLADQMAGSCMVVAAGGLEDGSIGTDAVRIVEAIRKAESGEGVLLLVDLGSAVLSSNMALELMEAAEAGRVRVADAPILEGAICAAVQASIGDGLDGVLAAAEEARGMSKL